MLLAKNCKHKDSLKVRKTIKLGTLDHYRTIEDEDLRDRGEGQFELWLKFDGPVELENIWLNSILSGSGFTLPGIEVPRLPARGAINFESLRIIEGNFYKTTLQTCKALVSREVLNGFIFCMSLVNEPNEAIGLFPKCDDCWYMDSRKAHAIADEISRLLIEKIEIGRVTGDHVVPADIPLNGLGVMFNHRLVEYVPRSIEISKASDMTMEKFVTLTEDMSFIKPASFSNEKEYRFTFTIFANDMMIEPIIPTVILDAGELASWAI